MKKTMMAAAIIGAVSLSGGAVIAGDHADWEAKLAAKFASMDANGDGAVSEREYLDHKAAKAREHFAEISGGDGSLTLEEAKAAQKKHYEKMKKKKKSKKDKMDG